MTQSRAPLIVAIVLLLLPVVYVGSYLALVKPYTGAYLDGFPLAPSYRWGGYLAARFFWPLEQIDRKLRPHTWESEY